MSEIFFKKNLGPWSLNLTWHTRWKVCGILWIYLTYPADKELVEKIWKGEAELVDQTDLLLPAWGLVLLWGVT